MVPNAAKQEDGNCGRNRCVGDASGRWSGGRATKLMSRGARGATKTPWPLSKKERERKGLGVGSWLPVPAVISFRMLQPKDKEKEKGRRTVCR